MSTVFSQNEDLDGLILKIKSTDRNAIESYQYILTRYDSTERFNSSICAEACEAIADIYKSRSEYTKAIAYYDSLYLKYRDQAQFCGNAIYGITVRQKLKVAQCYVGMKDTLQALAVLAPYIFQYENDHYCSGEPADFYVNLIKATYTREMLHKIMDASLDEISYSYEPLEVFSLGDTIKSNTYVDVTGSITLFNVQFAIAHYYLKPEAEAKLTDAVRKDFFAQTLKATQIIKNIYE